MTQVQSTTNAVIADFGRLDVMIANAGISSKAGGLDDRLEDWHHVVNVDFSGAYFCARIAGKIFRQQRSGNLIFTASMSGHAVNVPQQQVSRLLPLCYTPLTEIGLLQCLQSWRHSSHQIPRRRMGQLRPRQQRQPRLHRHGHQQRLSNGGEGGVVPAHAIRAGWGSARAQGGLFVSCK